MTNPNDAPSQEAYPKTFAQGVILGLVLGGALALWYAPQSGKATLNQVRDWVGQLPRRAEKAAERFQGDTIEQALQEGRALAHRHRAQQARSNNDNR